MSNRRKPFVAFIFVVGVLALTAWLVERSRTTTTGASVTPSHAPSPDAPSAMELLSFPYPKLAESAKQESPDFEGWLFNPEDDYAQVFELDRRLDGKGVIQHNYAENYGGAGWQYTPYLVSRYGLLGIKAWRQRRDQRGLGIAIAQANWLVENAVQRPLPGSDGGFATWTYRFPNSSFGAEGSWTSAFGNAFALVLLTQTYHVTQDERYLLKAREASRSFFVAIDSGGVQARPPRGEGVWFAEVASSEDWVPHILNGHTFAVFGLAYYAHYLNDSKAKALAKAGARAILDCRTLYDVDMVEKSLRYSLRPNRIVRTGHYALRVHALGLYYAGLIYEDEDARFMALRWASTLEEPILDLALPRYVLQLRGN